MSQNKNGLSRTELIHAAHTAMHIAEQGGYKKDDRWISLPTVGDRPFADAEVITSASPLRNNTPVAEATYALTNMGSFSAARLLLGHPERAGVHNFANARNPGGGFLHGARAQEESLCRESTLYTSLKSPAAESFYRDNKRSSGAFYPEAIVFSPSVAVFRDGRLQELDVPFATTVMTAAAPNRKGRAAYAGRDAVLDDMAMRFKLMLRAAKERNVSTLILGAWGCGAFGNDVRDVSRLFRHVLIDKGMGNYFGTIIFAVKASADDPKIASFQREFADSLGGNVFMDQWSGLPKLDR